MFSIKNKLSLKINNLVCKIKFSTCNIFKQQSVYSLNLFPSNLSEIINKSDYDIINFHWINHEMISLRDINKITNPLYGPFMIIGHFLQLSII